MGCIQPILLGNPAVPTCPDGYTYDPVQGLCCPTSSAPVDLNDPTIKKLVTGLADAEVDPHKAAQLSAEGWKDAHFIEHAVTAVFFGIIKLFRPILEAAAGLIDDSLAVLAEVFTAAQGQHSQGFYLLAGMLMTDTLGIETNGDELWQAFQSGGRQAAMNQLGGRLFDTLAAEFANITQTSTKGAFNFDPGTGLAGLPAVKLSPAQGIAGAKAFLGYLASFGIREGNTDFLASYLPFGAGEFFKDFAEDFAKSLGIGRMARVVYKPLVSTMVATPMQQAMNIQYRPTLPTPRQAYAMWNEGALTIDQLQDILARHGFDTSMNAALQYESMERPSRDQLRAGHAAGAIDDLTYNTWMTRIGYTPELIALLDTADDAIPMREAALAAAKHFAAQYLRGQITKVQFEGLLEAVQKNLFGQNMLTDGEIAKLSSLPAIGVGGTRKHLSYTQMSRLYFDGLITLQEFEADLVTLGYDPDAVTELTQELLVAQKRQTDRQAKANALAARGPLAKLTVAQMETGYTDGLFTIAEIQAELTARQYGADAINGLIAEFRIKAGLQTPGAPTT